MPLAQRFADPQYGHLLTPVTGQAIGAWVAAETGRPMAWAFAAALIAACGLWGWILVWRRRRAVADTPTSTIAGAAQGYVELFGTALPHDGHVLRATRTRLECVWFRWTVEEKRGDRWTVVDRGCSSDTFVLRDATGECVIDPDGAQVTPALRRRWFNAPYRFTEWVIRPGEALYALGYFRSVDEADPVVNRREDVNRLLAEWKKDRPGLLRRFDLDGNGDIDLAEWERAREAAHDAVEHSAAPLKALPELHLLGASPDGRPFILSSSDPGNEARRFGALLAWYAGSFAAAAVAALVLASGAVR